jgi:DNA polymerase I-like protein with 3'-5' exonuclease and polymerase domains
VHYAATTEPISFDQSVTKIVEKFKDNSVDFHQTVADMAKISRTQAKVINLGLFYGMGKAKLQAELGLQTKAEAEELFNQYHENVPFVRELMNSTSKHAQTSGSIGTLLGRRCRFDKWEPNQFGMHKAMSFEEAERTYGRGRIRRAYTYKALNKLIQGSAADMTKKAMLDLYKEGIIPHIQIHDELDISIQSDDQVKKSLRLWKMLLH